MDKIELICVGLQVLSIPFAWKHSSVNEEQLVTQDWLGSVKGSESGEFLDNYMLLIFGGIPYQVSSEN